MLGFYVLVLTADVKQSRRTRNLNIGKHLFKFLMGLDKSYTTCRGNILIMNPTPNVDKVYHLLLQEERQRFIQSLLTSPLESSSFNVSRQKLGNSVLGQFNNFSGNKNRCNTTKRKGNFRINMFCSYYKRPM